MTVPMFIFDGGRQWNLKPMEVIADLRQGTSPQLNCCFLALCVILVEGGHSTTSKSRHTLVEMCIDVFSTSSVHGERRCCTRCTLKFEKLFRTCGLVRKSTVLQGSRGVSEALMRPIYPLKSFRLTPTGPSWVQNVVDRPNVQFDCQPSSTDTSLNNRSPRSVE